MNRMNSKIIERDLLRILKSKKYDELLYSLINMANNTYNYEISYLNKVPYNERMIHLEKIISLGTKVRNFDNLENALLGANEFCENINKIRYEDLIKNKILNLKYWFKLREENTKNLLKKNKTTTKISCLILAGLIFVNMVGKKEVSKDDNTLSSVSYVTESIIDLQENKKSVNYVFDSAFNSVTTNHEKVEFILEKYNLTKEQFRVLCAIVLREAAPLSYDDAYAVINTIYNRTQSKVWNEDINKYFGMEVGDNLYYQATRPNQFVVYEEGLYQDKLDVTNEPGYQAIIDFLYTNEIKHDFLSFRANHVEVVGSTKFVSNGNNYFNPLNMEDRIEKEKER